MKILFLGDIFGRSGRDVVEKYLPVLKEKKQPDIIIANVENAAHGFGVTPKICDDLYDMGIHVLTTGNHVWDKKEIIPYLQNNPIIRPINYPLKTPGKGSFLWKTPQGKDILIINVMGRVFMDPLDDPFQAMDHILMHYTLGKNNLAAIFVDMHAETTSEKMSMAHYLNGRVSAVIGTHTHIPTADCQILNRGTAVQCDAGMCGDYHSVIGVDPAAPIYKFTRKMPGDRFVPASGEATLCGTFITVDPLSGHALSIEAIRLGPRLKETPL